MKFSVIIPVYNCEKYLKRCIKSVINQTYKDFELILINDGSTDGSRVICKWAEEKDHRVIFIEQENKGPSAARNRGIEKATGDFVIFIDADDYIEKSCFRELQDFLQNNDVDILFKGFKFENQRTGEILDEVALSKGVYDKSEFHSIIKKLIDNDLFGYTWCKVIKTKIFVEFNLRFNINYSLHEDLLLICQACEKVESIGVLDTTSYHYTKDEHTLCTKFRNNMIENMEYVNEQVFSFYKRINIDNIDKMIVQRAVFSIYLILKNYAIKSDIQRDDDKFRQLLEGKTIAEIKLRREIYFDAIKGKKKWIIYFVCMSKSLLLFKIMLLFYSKICYVRSA